RIPTPPQRTPCNECKRYKTKCSDEHVRYLSPPPFNALQTVIPYIPKSIGVKSNVYGISILLWEISSGRSPFCRCLYIGHRFGCENFTRS
ncbi:15014_t:CDS:2, partial [Funneliformis geosporum]